jgi:hypothetical protein
MFIGAGSCLLPTRAEIERTNEVSVTASRRDYVFTYTDIFYIIIYFAVRPLFTGYRRLYYGLQTAPKSSIIVTVNNYCNDIQQYLSARIFVLKYNNKYIS